MNSKEKPDDFYERFREKLRNRKTGPVSICLNSLLIRIVIRSID